MLSYKICLWALLERPFLDQIRWLAPEKMEMKMKVGLNSYPTNIRKLLSTGILEGVSVKYYKGEQGILRGIISGCGYLCGCVSCNFSIVVNAYVFEQHAGSKSKHPINCVMLDNGKSIYCAVQELRNIPLGSLDKVIQYVVGPSINVQSYLCWKESLRTENSPEVERKSEIGKVFQPKHLVYHHPVLSIPNEVREDSLVPYRTLLFKSTQPHRFP